MNPPVMTPDEARATLDRLSWAVADGRRGRPTPPAFIDEYHRALRAIATTDDHRTFRVDESMLVRKRTLLRTREFVDIARFRDRLDRARAMFDRLLEKKQRLDTPGER